MSLASWTTSGWLTTVWKALTEADGFCDLHSFGGNQRNPLSTHWSKGFYLVQRYSKLLSPSVQPPVKTLQWTNHSDNTSPTAQCDAVWMKNMQVGRKRLQNWCYSAFPDTCSCTPIRTRTCRCGKPALTPIPTTGNWWEVKNKSKWMCLDHSCWVSLPQTL